MRSGTTDRGKCPKSGTRSPGQFVPSPGQFVPSLHPVSLSQSIRAQGTVRPGARVPVRDTAPGLLSLSPHGRLADKQISNIHGIEEIQAAAYRTAGFLTIRDNRPGEVSRTRRDTFTRSICPFTRSVCPYQSRRKGQSDRVRMSQTWDTAPGLLSLSPHGRLADKQSSNVHGTVEPRHQHIGRRGSLRTGTTDRGKCPSSGHVHPVNLSL